MREAVRRKGFSGSAPVARSTFLSLVRVRSVARKGLLGRVFRPSQLSRKRRDGKRNSRRALEKGRKDAKLLNVLAELE
jgi:thioester reductase-like protein